ncbi:hypothetical protein [Citreimonas sp.]|uniref:hypothetical protein n=1 Tax=Citreimonas sp. TaxID=3036715 RepID=UPI004058FA04
MTTRAFFAAALLGLGFPGVAGAADFSDPTWPCIQRKVERLSVGLMWPRSIPEDMPQDPALRDAIAELGDKLAVRRIEPETLKPDIAAFAESHGGDADLLGHVFQQVFDSLSQRRARIIDGIAEFSLSQIALSERIEAARQEMDAEMAKADPDFDKVDALEEQIDWDQTIHTDRQQSITYLCETPTLLEKRLYGIAQLLQAEIEGS